KDCPEHSPTAPSAHPAGSSALMFTAFSTRTNFAASSSALPGPPPDSRPPRAMSTATPSALRASIAWPMCCAKVSTWISSAAGLPGRELSARTAAQPTSAPGQPRNAGRFAHRRFLARSRRRRSALAAPSGGLDGQSHRLRRAPAAQRRSAARFYHGRAAVAAAAATTLATRGLLDAVKRIEAPLRAGDLAGARANLSHIVGRDTAHLDRDKVLAAGLESLAESTCDGIVAPLFYLFIGGLPLALAYKAVSTLDSMIGYPTERYFYFGKFAARLDDLANFLPARLTAGFIVVAAAALGLNPARAWRIAWRDRACHLSPNAGYPEAAFAGAFGVRLGGPGVYFGKEIRKPYIGDNVKSLEIDSLKKGRALCLATALLALATFALLASARS